MDFKREKEKRWEGWIVARRKVIVKEKGSTGLADDHRLKRGWPYITQGVQDITGSHLLSQCNSLTVINYMVILLNTLYSRKSFWIPEQRITVIKEVFY